VGIPEIYLALADRGATAAGLPAAVVPMAAQVSGTGRDGHEVPQTGRDVPIAARADVRLVRLVRLDATHLGGFPNIGSWHGPTVSLRRVAMRALRSWVAIGSIARSGERFGVVVRIDGYA